jgi:putative peptidoglycan lipid II flippase
MMAAGTFSSRLLGLVREMALAAFFDRTITDAWTAAFRLPNLLRRILGEGSLSVSLQPILIQTQFEDQKKGTHRARGLLESLHLLLIVVLTVLTVLGILFSEPILKLILDTHYQLQVEAFALTVRLAQIMFGFLFFICLFAYYMAILNAAGSFGWPAAAPVLFNVSLILSTLLPADLLPVRGDTLAWGVLFGGFLQMAILIWPLKARRLLPGFRWNPLNPEMLLVLRNMIPGLLGLGLMQITLLINTHFASRLGRGAISYIYWADRLLELPLSLVSVSLGTALLPTLAEHWIRGDQKKMAEIGERYLSLNIFVGAMAAVGLSALALPIVKVLFERGHFHAHDSAAVVQVLQVYSLSLIPVSCIRVLAPSYYAVKNTWFPALSSALSLGAHVLLAPRLMASYGLPGLNFSSFVSSALNISLLLGAYSFLVTKFPWPLFLLKALKTLLSAAVMGALCFYLEKMGSEPVSLLGWLWRLMATGALGLLGFLGAAVISRHPDTLFLISKIKARWSRSSSSL